MATTECCTPCSTTPPTQIVGAPGTDGAPGAAGAGGVNSFTFTTADFVVPAIAANVTILVANNSWMTVGQNVFAQGAGMFSVVSKSGSTGVTLTYLNYVGNTFATTNIVAGAQVSPGATQPVINNPLLIANGGTSSATKATAQVALGLGQNATITTGAAIAYDITNAAATITGITVTVPTTGLYLIMAWASVDYAGVTFAASRVLTLKVRNTTAGSDVVTTARATQIQTTTNFPSHEYSTPFITATLTAAQVLALQINLDTVETAGSSVVNAASLCIVPLALS